MISNKSFNELGRAKDGDRKFYDLPANESASVADNVRSNDSNSTEKLFELIRNSEIGHEQTFQSPFGAKKGELPLP